MDTALRLSAFSLVVSALSAIISYRLYRADRNQKRLQNFFEQTQRHASLEIFLATRRLWQHYRKFPGGQFLDQYITVMKQEQQQASEMNLALRADFERTTLHYQRKQLTQFWRGLAFLLKQDLIPREDAYKWWQSADVAIVTDVLIPIENKLADSIPTPRFDPQADVLFYLASIRDKFY